MGEGREPRPRRHVAAGQAEGTLSPPLSNMAPCLPKKKKKTAKTLSPGTGVEKEHANSTNSSSKTRGNVSAVAKSADGAVAATGSDSSLLPVKPSCLAPRGLGRGQVYFSHFLSRLSSHLADCSCALRGRTDGPAPAGSSSREGHEEANGVF